MSVGPNLRPGIRFADKRIIRRHRAVVVHPQNLSRQRVQLLRQLALRGIARRNIKLAVGSKTQAASRMKLRCRNVFDNDFAISEASRRLTITNYAHELAAGVVSIRKIEQMIGSELRMQRHTHQSAFTLWLDVGNGEERLWTQLPIFVDTHASRPLGKDHPAIQRPDNRPHE